MLMTTLPDGSRFLPQPSLYEKLKGVKQTPETKKELLRLEAEINRINGQLGQPPVKSVVKKRGKK